MIERLVALLPRRRSKCAKHFARGNFFGMPKGSRVFTACFPGDWRRTLRAPSAARRRAAPSRGTMGRCLPSSNEVKIPANVVGNRLSCRNWQRDELMKSPQTLLYSGFTAMVLRGVGEVRQSAEEWRRYAKTKRSGPSPASSGMEPAIRPGICTLQRFRTLATIESSPWASRATSPTRRTRAPRCCPGGWDNAMASRWSPSRCWCC